MNRGDRVADILEILGWLVVIGVLALVVSLIAHSPPASP